MAGEKIHTTNYLNTFIEVAEDCPALCGTIPPSRPGKRSIAEMQYEMLAANPYAYTSDEVFFQIFALRNDLTEGEYEEARKEFFSKGRPCFRSSPLTQTYGFGIHSDEAGRVALCGVETDAYQAFLSAPGLKKVKAMRSSRKARA